MAWILSTGESLKSRGRLLPCPRILAETSALAEEIVFEHYAPSPRLLKRLQYETLFFKGVWPFPGEALAVLLRTENSSPQNPSSREAYLILFPYGRSLPFGRGFLPALMLYIFTHELIHMIRFARYEAAYEMPPEKKLQEERWVHRKTRELLGPLHFIPGLPETLAYFDRHYEGR